MDNRKRTLLKNRIAILNEKIVELTNKGNHSLANILTKAVNNLIEQQDKLPIVQLVIPVEVVEPVVPIVPVVSPIKVVVPVKPVDVIESIASKREKRIQKRKRMI